MNIDGDTFEKVVSYLDVSYTLMLSITSKDINTMCKGINIPQERVGLVEQCRRDEQYHLLSYLAKLKYDVISGMHPWENMFSYLPLRRKIYTIAHFLFWCVISFGYFKYFITHEEK